MSREFKLENLKTQKLKNLRSQESRKDRTMKRRYKRVWQLTDVITGREVRAEMIMC